MEYELSDTVSIHKVREAVKQHIASVFNIELVPISFQVLSDILRKIPGNA